MNHTERKISEDDHLIDMLVDGELEPAQRRDLLSRLDSEPQGWRRCAMAFLESQAFSEDIGRAGREPARIAAPSRKPRYGLTILAMAASFLVALVLGMQITGGSQTESAGEEIASPEKKDDLPEEEGTGPRWRVVDLATADAPEATNEEDLLQNTPSAIPENVLEALRKAGHTVNRRVRLVPSRLEDGRRLVVPVESYDIQLISDQQPQ